MLQMAPTNDPAGEPGAEGAARRQDEGQPLRWYEMGACRGMDPNLFFPGRGEKIPDEVVEVCRSCIVRRECETAGQGEFGIWGGLSERARLRVRRVSRRAGEEESVDSASRHEDSPSLAGGGPPQADASSAA